MIAAARISTQHRRGRRFRDVSGAGAFARRAVIGSWALIGLPLILVACRTAPRSTAPRSTTPPRTTAAGHRLTRLFAEDWQVTLREFPLWATRVGEHRYDDRLPEVGEAAQVRRVAHDRRMLTRWRAIDRAGLSAAEQLNYDLFARLKQTAIAEASFNTHLLPITSRGGFHVTFPQLPRLVPLETPRDHRNYIARLRAFRRWAQQHVAVLRRAVARKYVLPRIIWRGTLESLAVHVVDDPTKSLLYRPYTKPAPAGFSSAQWTSLRQAAREAIRRSVVPGYRRFLAFMRREYLPASREKVGASELPRGRAFYRFRVRRFTTLSLTPRQVHDIGLREVARIGAEMRKVMAQVGFTGEFAAFLAFLRSDARFYAATPEALLKEVAFVLKRIDGQLPRLFGRLPRAPYGIRRIPSFIAPKTTTAYYRRPAGDGTRAGFYYVNTHDLKSRPLYEVEALSLHEAVPGHHLQIAIQQELRGLPAFRRYQGFTAFTEGWALYAERLGLEVGMYRDPYRNFGRLTYEMWRACRLVVDTGMHYFGWSRQKAIDYMAARTALSLHNVTTEIDRYIAWPGQALAYKIGELRIRALRREAARRLGPRFDVRAFHDVVLGAGALPLDLLQRRVRRWINASAATSPSRLPPRRPR